MVAGPHVVITVLGPTIACRSRLTDIDPTETIIMIIANYYVEIDLLTRIGLARSVTACITQLRYIDIVRHWTGLWLRSV